MRILLGVLRNNLKYKTKCTGFGTEKHRVNERFVREVTEQSQMQNALGLGQKSAESIVLIPKESSIISLFLLMFVLY